MCIRDRLRLYTGGLPQLWHFPSAFLQGADQLRNEDQCQRGTAWRSDFLWKRQEHQPCGDVYWKWPGGACQQFPDRHYHFEYVLQKSGKRSADYQRLRTGKGSGRRENEILPGSFCIYRILKFPENLVLFFFISKITSIIRSDIRSKINFHFLREQSMIQWLYYT